MTFTPQKVLNAARRRHPALTTVLLDDEQIVDDYNAAQDEVVSIILQHNEMLLAAKSDSLAITGADGSSEDLDFTTGELLRVLDLSCTKSAAEKKVIIKDIRHRETLAAEFTDDTRPVGAVLWNPSTGLWTVEEIVNWTGVTALWAYGVFKPTKATTATLTTANKLPDSFFLPLTEAVAVLLAARADLDAQWMQLQTGKVQAALSGLVGKSVNFAQYQLVAPRPGAVQQQAQGK